MTVRSYEFVVFLFLYFSDSLEYLHKRVRSTYVEMARSSVAGRTGSSKSNKISNQMKDNSGLTNTDPDDLPTWDSEIDNSESSDGDEVQESISNAHSGERVDDNDTESDTDSSQEPREKIIKQKVTSDTEHVVVSKLSAKKCHDLSDSDSG